jgi:putative hydrolase of the HAD superfamily
VLFDATGTLIELREPVGETYSRLGRDHGVTLPAWRLDEAFGRVLRRAPPRVFPDTAPGEIAARERTWWWKLVRDTFRAADSTVAFPDFEAFFSEAFEHYATAQAWRLRPYAARALRALRSAKLLVGVVSNFDQRLTKILKAIEIDDLFDSVTLPADCGAEKPDPRIFAAALSSLGVAAEEALYVGDDLLRDLAAARSAGLRALDASQLASLMELPARLDSIATLEA